MLDKTIPYKDIIMKADKTIASQHFLRPLPQGYRYHMYEQGDEIGWANLETSVEEFCCVEDANAYFQRVFQPHIEEVKKRMCFILNPANEIVSTACAWYKEDEQRRYALLHWVSTSPSEQGKGLARAVVRYALSIFTEVEPREQEIFLHTQTWSYKAIALYHALGFRITTTPLIDCATDMECISILRSCLPEDLLCHLCE